ncbi:hypothetical protein TNCV_4811471 [Trichonephila clavipes]|nr:hypothetical protein TNCV_4811471 [Trichonephila clavipes]
MVRRTSSVKRHFETNHKSSCQKMRRKNIHSPTLPGQKGGSGSPMVKVTDSWVVCHEFESSTTEDSPCREAMRVTSVESSNVLPLVWYGS